MLQKEINLYPTQKETEIVQFPKPEKIFDTPKDLEKKVVPILKFNGGLINKKWKGVSFIFVVASIRCDEINYNINDNGKFTLGYVHADDELDEEEFERYTETEPDYLSIEESRYKKETLITGEPSWVQYGMEEFADDYGLEFVAQLEHSKMFGTLYLFYDEHFGKVTQRFQCS